MKWLDTLPDDWDAVGDDPPTIDEMPIKVKGHRDEYVARPLEKPESGSRWSWSIYCSEVVVCEELDERPKNRESESEVSSGEE